MWKFASLALILGCSDPKPADCKFECGNGAVCPSGLSCLSGMCRVPENAGEACEGTIDAPLAIDVSEIDAPPPDVNPDLCTWALVGTNFSPSDVDDPAPPAKEVATDETYTTGAVGGHPIAQSNGPDLWVVQYSSFKVAAGATYTIEGVHPLVIAADTIDIEGTIVVKNGGNPTTCNAMRGADVCIGGTGGGGGGYGGLGGDGGGAAGAGGAIDGVASTPLRGGCNGAQGGDGRTSGTDATPKLGGLGGNGAGALQLSARLTLTVSGTITANGAGGLPGTSDHAGGGACGNLKGRASGGGGGGGGGTIVLESCQTIVTAAASVCANGGGGGGGAGGGSTDTGVGGAPGACAAVAGGGAGEDGKSGGGVGGFDGQLAGPGAIDARGGGGGGGAVGRIHIRQATGTPSIVGATIRPAANRSQ